MTATARCPGEGRDSDVRWRLSDVRLALGLDPRGSGIRDYIDPASGLDNVFVNATVAASVFASADDHAFAKVNATVNAYGPAFAHVTANASADGDVFANARGDAFVFATATVLKGHHAMPDYDLTIKFTGRYIADPYWPEMHRLIDIQKTSGFNRARSEEARNKALDAFLKNNGMTLEDYEELERLARRPFHTDDDGVIVIPPEKVHAFLVNTAAKVPSAQRFCDQRQVRVRIGVTAWRTEKTEADGVWGRFAVVTSGTGNKLSNQRGYRESAYIESCTATGRISIDDEFVKPKVLRRGIAWGGDQIGIGASRKMGCGRFTVEEFRAQE